MKKLYSYFKLFSFLFLISAAAAQAMDEKTIAKQQLSIGQLINGSSSQGSLALPISMLEEKSILQDIYNFPQEIRNAISFLKIGEFFLMPETFIDEPNVRVLSLAMNESKLFIHVLGNIEIYDINSKRLLHTFRGQTVAVNGNKVAIGLLNNTVEIRDINSGELLHILENAGSRSMAIDGNKIVTGALCGMIKVWDITNGKLIREYSKCNKGLHGLNSVAISGDKIIVGSEDTSRIYDINTDEVITLLVGPFSGVWSVSISGDRAVTGSRNGTVNIWDTNGQLLHTLDMTHDNLNTFGFGAFATVISGDKIVIGLRNGTTMVLDIHGELLYTLPKQDSAIWSVAISGNKIATGLDNGVIKIWPLYIDLNMPEFNTYGEAFTSMKNTLILPQAELIARIYNASQVGQPFTIIDQSEDGKVFLTLDKAVRMYLLNRLNIKLEIDNLDAQIEALFAPISNCSIQ